MYALAIEVCVVHMKGMAEWSTLGVARSQASRDKELSVCPYLP